MITARKQDRGTTRRRISAGVTALLLGTLVLAAFAGGTGASAAPTATGAGQADWTFTDDRGTKVSLDSRPLRIVAYETAASALWYLGIKPVGIFGSTSLTQSPLLDGVDVRGIKSLGKVYGEINLEQLAALKPDLIVTAYSPKFNPLWGFKDAKQQKTVEAFAPIVAINGIRLPTQVIRRYEALARSLGANLRAAKVVAARTRFSAAVKELRAATKAKPGLLALAVGAYGDQLYFAKPADFPALRQYRSWGLKMVVPGGKDSFWEIVSFEQADKYPADLILYDTRTGALGPKDLAKKPAWNLNPAVKAGQLVPWQGQEDWSYQLYTKDIRTLARAVRRANPNLVR
jgi:iron complex transport system substrate-binding protein